MSFANLSGSNASALTDDDALGSGGGWPTGTLRSIGFVFSIAAICVPMVQLLEQRCVTPYFNLCKKRSANPLVLLAAGYMLAMSLPRQVRALPCKPRGLLVPSAMHDRGACLCRAPCDRGPSWGVSPCPCVRVVC